MQGWVGRFAAASLAGNPLGLNPHADSVSANLRGDVLLLNVVVHV